MSRWCARSDGVLSSMSLKRLITPIAATGSSDASNRSVISARSARIRSCTAMTGDCSGLATAFLRESAIASSRSSSSDSLLGK